MTETSNEEILEQIVALADSFHMTGYDLLRMIQSRTNEIKPIKEEVIITLGVGVLMKGTQLSVDERVAEMLKLATDSPDNDLYND